jgi:hypothetical protein
MSIQLGVSLRITPVVTDRTRDADALVIEDRALLRRAVEVKLRCRFRELQLL